MSRSTLRIVVIILTAITGVVHLYLGLSSLLAGRFGFLGIAWLLNGLGYAALLAANFANVPYFKKNRTLAGYLLFGFAIVTILAWAYITGVVKITPAPTINFAGRQNPLAIPDKIDEVLLVIAAFFYTRSK